MSRNEARIRELAYQIWESEGCPQGQATRHWELACILAETVAAHSAAPTAGPRRITRPCPVPLDETHPGKARVSKASPVSTPSEPNA
ncbi:MULTISPECIES: DUF2934 domain-containing protein [unclassified Pseudomonas]|jgi:hypothetical protein|uniref:DUF2934 domain-containing protein n=1 Tax=unclassified Pseudomonas TaxID=196821 RepID=UPI000EA93F97|nr:DUF2934 domain-containing protein [Pseudomonas sp. DY-1]